MPRSKEFVQLMDEIKVLHEKKSNDYTTSGAFENFERMAAISGWFKDGIDQVFATMIAVKLARLASLLGRNKTPNNESVIDSFKDMTTYSGLWAAYHMRALEFNKIDSECSNKVTELPGMVVNLPRIELTPGAKMLNPEMDKRVAEIFEIAYDLPADKLAILTSEARRLVMKQCPAIRRELNGTMRIFATNASKTLIALVG